VACTQIYGGPATARVRGTLHGKQVDASFELTNGCEIERWDRNRVLLDDAPAGGAPPADANKTTIVFALPSTPGALFKALSVFALRDINLTKLESRPTKKGLGNYCFLIDLEGHIGDELVADCLRDLKSKVEDVKFLGSYPAAGEHGPARRREAEVRWREASEWVDALRREIG
jgi:prephenate dehydratase